MKRTALITVLLAMAASTTQAQSLFDMAKAVKTLQQAAEQPTAAAPQTPQAAPAAPSALDNVVGQAAQQANSASTASKPAASSYEAMLSTIETELMAGLAKGSTDPNVLYQHTRLKEKQQEPIGVFQNKHSEWLKANCANFSDFFEYGPERYIPVAVLDEPVGQDLIEYTTRLNKKNSFFLQGAASNPNQRDYRRCEGRSPKEMADLLFQRLQSLRPQFQKLAAQAVEDKKQADLAEANRKAEEQRKANAKAEAERAKNAARLAELKSGKAKATTFEDFALLYSPKVGDDIIASPLVQADKGYYKMTAHLTRTDGDKWFFSVDKMGSVEKPKVVVVEQRSNVYTSRPVGGGGYESKVVGKSFFQMEKSGATVVNGQMRINGFYGVVGQYVDNIKVRLTNGAEETIPVFKLAYIEAL